MTALPLPRNTANPESPGGALDPLVDRELRLAVTMNGGVSLAVYIGGVAHEFNRLTRGADGYSGLLTRFGYASSSGESSGATDLGSTDVHRPTERLPIIDVITGTSAGGINAAALALAQADVHGDLSLLKGLWIQHGQIGDLLREPFHKGPPSILKGDDYFYPQILAAFKRLTEKFERANRYIEQTYDTTDPDNLEQLPERPVDLTIPTTLLTPIETFTVDDLGTSMVQPQHAGLFHFRGGVRHAVSDDGPKDMFSMGAAKDGSNAKEFEVTVEALALAARASAGFPVAFEPTFVPVRHDRRLSDDRKDMHFYANWAHTGRKTDDTKDLSRFAIDGGVLTNTPTQSALAAIRRQSVTDTLVRRVLILVHPHAEYEPDIENVPDDANKQPTLAGTLAGVLQASGSVGSRTYVEEVRQHNNEALRWRNGREAATAQFSVEELSAFVGESSDAQPAWRLFRLMRLRRGAYVSAHHVREQFTTPFPKLVDYAEEVLREADARDNGLPFLPTNPPTAEDFTEDAWPWGLQLAAGLSTQVTDLLRQLINARRLVPESVLVLARAAWKVSVNGGIELDRLADEEVKAESGSSERRQPHSLDGPLERQKIVDCLTRNLASYTSQMLAQSPNKPGEDDEEESSAASAPWGSQTMVTLRRMALMFANVIRALNELPDQTLGAEPTPLAAWRPGLLDPNHILRQGNPDANELLKRMLQIEIVSYLTAEHDSTDGTVPTAPIEFVQLSAHISQHFAEGFSADDKLAGMSLNRFGAFLKRSWRANDWIWGRLDAVKILMLILITPEMVRGVSARGTAEAVVDEIARAAFHDRGDEYAALIDGSREPQGPLHKLRTDAVKEVRRTLLGDDAPLTALASLAAYGFQIVVADEEVPWLASTIRDDRDDGALGSRSAEFLNKLGDGSQRGGYELLTAFATSRIGQEALGEQMPSDLMIRTTATAAAAAVTALSSDGSGLGFAQPATKAARGMVAVPYWVLVGLTTRGHIARAIATLVLAFGVSLLAVSLFADLTGVAAKLVPTAGVASLLTVLIYGTMRTRSIVHGSALLGLFIPLIAYAVEGSVAKAGANVAGTTIGVGCVLMLIVWVIVVANFAPNSRTPAGTGLRFIDFVRHFVKLRWRTILFMVVPLSTVAIFAYRYHENIARIYARSVLPSYVALIVREFRDSPWNGDVWSLVTVAIICAFLMGCATAYVKSKRFRPSTQAGLPRRARLADPAGLATAWAPVYGFIYLVIGVGLVTILPGETPQWATIASQVSIMLGLAFALGAVVLIPHLRERRLVRRLVAHFGRATIPEGDEPMIDAFSRVGEFSGYLTTDATPPQLSRHGQRVAYRVRELASARNTSSLKSKKDAASPSLR